jgi:hypothetical protein
VAVIRVHQGAGLTRDSYEEPCESSLAARASIPLRTGPSKDFWFTSSEWLIAAYALSMCGSRRMPHAGSGTSSVRSCKR